jgi:hypothetical protein
LLHGTNQFISLHPLLERKGWLKGKEEISVPVWGEGKKEEAKGRKKLSRFFLEGTE